MSKNQSIARTAMIILTGSLIASAVSIAMSNDALHPKGLNLSGKIISFVQSSYSS